MTKNRQQRRAELRELRRYVQAIRPGARFFDLQKLQRRDPDTAGQFEEMISDRGYLPSDVLLYDHAGGTSIMFPQEHD
jgi:hypothetical protein